MFFLVCSPYFYRLRPVDALLTLLEGNEDLWVPHWSAHRYTLPLELVADATRVGCIWLRSTLGRPFPLYLSRQWSACRHFASCEETQDAGPEVATTPCVCATASPGFNPTRALRPCQPCGHPALDRQDGDPDARGRDGDCHPRQRPACGAPGPDPWPRSPCVMLMISSSLGQASLMYVSLWLAWWRS